MQQIPTKSLSSSLGARLNFDKKDDKNQVGEALDGPGRDSYNVNINAKSQKIPAHLEKYVVGFSQTNYTPEDQAVWRFSIRQLKKHLALYGHDSYLVGLVEVGICEDEIPDIRELDRRLQKYGWGAVAVSGFIPPSAFMEFQSLGYLPIASEIRNIDHILYTPAPDIIHEAAGHAPIIVHSEYSSYLKQYATVAKKAIVGVGDLKIYAAIRKLSDLKELASVSDEEVAAAESELHLQTSQLQYNSEAARLGRMNWWTAEYGLIGELDAPKIYGAGLLSSVGESKSCLENNIKKLPLTLQCIEMAYDITEPQPQLYVTPSFNHLKKVLVDLADTMAFIKGGSFGLLEAQQAGTVCTVELNSGLQISGIMDNILFGDDFNKEPFYLKFSGPCQLSCDDLQLKGHGKELHEQGYGTPLGKITGEETCLSEWTEQKLEDKNIKIGVLVEFCFSSGVNVKGILREIKRNKNKIILLGFTECTVLDGADVLFDPAWGQFDMGVGSTVLSVYGGPADSVAYGVFEDFQEVRVAPKKYSDKKLKIFKFYTRVKQLRGNAVPATIAVDELIDNVVGADCQSEWLLGLEILELIETFDIESGKSKQFRQWLENLDFESPDARTCYRLGCDLL